MAAFYTEADYENSVIELFRGMGYRHIYDPDLERDVYSPLYEGELEAALHRLNPSMPEAAIADALYRLKHFENAELVQQNALFTDYIQHGITRLMNQGGRHRISLPEMNARVNALLAQSIKASGVINLFSDIDGDFSLFDPKFLDEVARMKEKNIAVELLKRLISEQVSVYRRENVVKSEKFSELLRQAMNRYLGGMLTNEQVTEALRRSRTIDWQRRESARAGMRMMIKRLLKKHRYPPEGEDEALQTVMTQCELWADHADMEARQTGDADMRSGKRMGREDVSTGQPTDDEAMRDRQQTDSEDVSDGRYLPPRRISASRSHAFSLESGISLVVVAVVDALYIDLTAGYLVGQCRLQKHLDLNISDGAALHREEVVLLIDLAPVNNHADLAFQHMIKPDAGTATIALSERMGDIHLHIFFDDFIKISLRHRVNAGQCRIKIHQGSKSKTALCKLDRAQLPREVVDILEEIPVNRLQSGKSTGRE